MARRIRLQYFPRLKRRRAAAGRGPSRRLGGFEAHVARFEPLEYRLPLAVDLQVRFEFADAQGHELAALHSGDNFLLNVYVQDIRLAAAGVFQAYLDLNYPEDLLSVSGAVTHGAAYDTVPFADTSATGLVDEAGGIDTDQLAPSPAGAEFLLFSVPMHADAEGPIALTAGLADNPARKIVLFDRVSGSLIDEIQFVGGAMDVTPATGAPTLTTISTLAGATEDTAYTISYATLAAAANEADPEGQSVSFRVESVASGTLTKNGTPVVAGATLLAAGESLVWTPASQANGTLGAFTTRAFDGSLASTAAVPVLVSVAAVNDAPSFLNGADQWLDTAGAHSVSGWAGGISCGPADEAGQVPSFQVTTDNDGLFSVLPAIAANGTLSYTLIASAKGIAQVTVTLKDNGGTANSGQDTSAPQPFLLLVNQDSLWQNPRDPLDVDANMTVEPLDLLWVINDLIANGLHALAAPLPPNVPPPFLDVDGNRFVYPLDALVLVNHFIATGQNVGGTGHTVAGPSAVAASAVAPVAPAGASADNSSEKSTDAVFAALACGASVRTQAGERVHDLARWNSSGAAATCGETPADSDEAPKTLAAPDRAGARRVDLALCELHQSCSDEAVFCADDL